MRRPEPSSVASTLVGRPDTANANRNVRNPSWTTPQQRLQLDPIQEMNRGLGQRRRADTNVDAVTEDKVHVHDLHATILHLLGLDHQKLTYRYGGHDDTLTDVDGEVVNGILIVRHEKRLPRSI